MGSIFKAIFQPPKQPAPPPPPPPPVPAPAQEAPAEKRDVSKARRGRAAGRRSAAKNPTLLSSKNTGQRTLLGE